MGVVDQAKDIVGSLPTFIGDFIQPYLDDAEGFVKLIFSSVEDIAKYAAVLSSALATLSSIIKKYVDALATMTGLLSMLLTLRSSDLDLAVAPAQQVAKCRGVPENCLGIMVVLGMVIKNLIPGLRDSLPGVMTLITGGYLTQIETYGDKLIDGGFSGDKSSARELKDYVNSVIGTVSIVLPASVKNSIKVPIDILNDLLDSVNSC
jgi:hypothetical protein